MVITGRCHSSLGRRDKTVLPYVVDNLNIDVEGVYLYFYFGSLTFITHRKYIFVVL